MTTSALLFATAASPNGGPAAALPADGSSVLGRLLAQLESLGVDRIWLVTRPHCEETVAEAAAASAHVTVVASEDVAGDLRTTAEIAARARGRLIIASAHVLTHREALAGLLADPRVVSGVLGTSSRTRGAWSFRIRTVRGRVVSADSPYHRVGRPNGYFLGFVKLDARDREKLAGAARRLAELVAERPPDGWAEEFRRKTGEFRVRLWRVAVERETGTLPDAADAPEPASIALAPDAEAELALRLCAFRQDVVPLLLVGLLRAGVHLSLSSLRGFFYATPLTARATESAVAEMAGYDEDRVALDAAVKARDSFFTTFFVSPYSKYLARFAARRGWSPNAITVLSMAIGVVAAAAFAAGTRASLVAGAVLLQVAFTVDCVDGQLARYSRTFSRLGGWLDSVSDRTKEYVVYAGLAIGASRGFGDDVWLLAAAALALQTTRHMLDFSYAARQHHEMAASPHLPLEQPEDAPLAIDAAARDEEQDDRALAPPAAPGAPALVAEAPPRARAAERGNPRPYRRRQVTVSTLGRRAVDLARALERRPWTRWGMRILVLPIGERFALISVTAAVASPRVTFIALLAWGSVAAAYAIAGRTLASLAR